MKTKILTIAVITASLMLCSGSLFCQGTIKVKNFSEKLPEIELEEKTPQKYLMIVEYFNKDIYGNFKSKIKVTGEYTRGLKDKYVKWNNVFIFYSNDPLKHYTGGVKQDYMENITYIPSNEVLQESFFNAFENSIDNVFSRNLVWDMFSIELFAWNFYDSLQLNKTYLVPEINESFNMADIGTYHPQKNEVNWIGISMMNDNLCAIIENKALSNIFELNFENMNSVGTESYFGKTWVSLKNKQIEYAEMHSTTAQEVQIKGVPGKSIATTTRILTLERIN